MGVVVVREMQKRVIPKSSISKKMRHNMFKQAAKELNTVHRNNINHLLLTSHLYIHVPE